MKKLLLATLLVCSTSVYAQPSAEIRTLAKSFNMECQSNAQAPDACTIAYFNIKGDVVEKLEDRQFFRVLLGASIQKALVRAQDFHINGLKQTDPFEMAANHDALLSWSSTDMGSQGPFTFWSDSGKKVATATYANGKKVGLEQAWTPDGKLFAEITYKDGFKTGTATIWQANGIKQVSEITGLNYDDKLNAEVTQYYANGNKLRAFTVKDGLPTGVSYFWTEEGKKKRKIIYNEKGEAISDEEWK